MLGTGVLGVDRRMCPYIFPEGENISKYWEHAGTLERAYLNYAHSEILQF